MVYRHFYCCPSFGREFGLLYLHAVEVTCYSVLRINVIFLLRILHYFCVAINVDGEIRHWPLSIVRCQSALFWLLLLHGLQQKSLIPCSSTLSNWQLGPQVAVTGTVGWTYAAKAGRLSSSPGRVMLKTWKKDASACLVSSLVLGVNGLAQGNGLRAVLPLTRHQARKRGRATGQMALPKFSQTLWKRQKFFQLLGKTAAITLPLPKNITAGCRPARHRCSIHCETGYACEINRSGYSQFWIDSVAWTAC